MSVRSVAELVEAVVDIDFIHILSSSERWGKRGFMACIAAMEGVGILPDFEQIHKLCSYENDRRLELVLALGDL
jgi:hypothetical protein